MTLHHLSPNHRRLPLLPLLLAATGALAACARNEAPAPVAATPPAVRYEAHVEAGGTPPPGAILTNPHAHDAAAAKQGAALFLAMNCDGCHASDASGYIGPSLADGRWRYGGADSEVFSSIYYGRPKGMPAFGGVLGTEGVWMVVSWLRSLPLADDAPTESWVGEGK
ncbi:MAG TPA: c-type cytochrome [Steroidobacteraceae bacterium]|jgi:cytochrome c oxidase cbb3-type subunit 3|nr:c-type cytochrome [Steroidobacteraceae bacterium]